MILSLIFEAVKTGFGWHREKNKAKHERDMAQINNQTRLLSERESNNAGWQMANLNDKDKIIRMGAFLIYASPILGYWISPALGARVQEGWNQLTPMQGEVLRIMCLAVFGINQGTKILGSTISSVAQALKRK